MKQKRKFEYYVKRYKDLKKLYVGKTGILKSLGLFIDYIFSMGIYGASINDYFAYRFYRLRHNAKKRYLTAGKHKKLQKICNNDGRGVEICRNKIKFNKYFNDKLGRNWLDFNNVSFEEFSQFIDSSSSEIFIKDAEGLCGKGISVIDPKSIDKKILYGELKKEIIPFILETKIHQHGELAEFHPNSINTIRLTTLYDPNQDKVHILKANLRFGRGTSSVDNMKSGGIAAHVDIETGIVDSPGFDDYNNKYLVHPDSKKQIVGFKVPFWEESKEFIVKVAKLLPSVKYIGWDVVSVGDGSFILIEANDNGGPNMQQYNKDGIWDIYKRLLKSLI